MTAAPKLSKAERAAVQHQLARRYASDEARLCYYRAAWIEVRAVLPRGAWVTVAGGADEDVLVPVTRAVLDGWYDRGREAVWLISANSAQLTQARVDEHYTRLGDLIEEVRADAGA